VAAALVTPDDKLAIEQHAKGDDDDARTEQFPSFG
jgi:hypothetical protein